MSCIQVNVVQRTDITSSEIVSRGPYITQLNTAKYYTHLVTSWFQLATKFNFTHIY